MAQPYDPRSEEEIMAANNQWANTPVGPTPEQTRAAAEQGRLNFQKPKWNAATRSYVFIPMNEDEKRIAQETQLTTQPVAPPPTLPTVADLPTGRQPAPPPALTPAQRLEQLAASGGLRGTNQGFIQAPLITNRFQLTPESQAALRARTAPFFAGMDVGQGPGGTLPGNPTSENPEAGGAPEVDRAKIDQLLGNVSKATSGVMGIAENANQYSQAQAQLAQGIAATQNQSLALARSGNRRDSAALGARALQTNAELGAEATRSAAGLRAQEEDANRRLRLDAYKAAGDLGLNAAALDLDVNRLNMTAATDYLNNLFETNRLNLQLDEAEAARVTNFMRDMALIAKDYYALGQAERQSIRDDLTRRYGISEQSKAAFAQLDAQPGFWEQAALGIIGGAGQGASAALTTFALSDARRKTDIEDSTDEELEELLTTVKSQTYTYKGARAADGKQFGLMAQDLQRSRLGRGMVESTTDGTLLVNGAKAGTAALSAVSKIYDRLKALEASL